MSLLSTLLHRPQEIDRRFATCEGFATYPITPLHLREIVDDSLLYFGGGLMEDGITAACGTSVNWDDHLYSSDELEATLPQQGGAFHFCRACLTALAIQD